MVEREVLVEVNFPRPSIVMQGLRHLPIFPLGGVKNQWRNVDMSLPPKPRGMPKRGFSPVSYRDDSGGVENLHVMLRARVPGSRPNLRRILPLQPRPTEAKGRRKFIHVQDAKAPKFLWPTNRFPINFTFCSRSVVLCGPKESAFDLVDEGNCARGDGEQG
jgi:hypothetical protein